MNTPQRIAKVIAAAGLCSRREAERWIESGRVAVDGVVLQSPALQVDGSEDITIDGKKLPSVPTVQIWRFHKPKGCITSHSDEQGRKTIYDFLPSYMKQLHTVGRLDYNSEGLLLLTNSPAVKRHLELPATAIARTYRVRVQGLPKDSVLAKLAKGVAIEGVHYKPVQARVQPGGKGRNHWLEVVLTEGKNREIRRLFEHFGHPVSRLIRTGYGAVELGSLSVSAVEAVKAEIVEGLLPQQE